jgi:uncharacterized membrane protein
MSGSGSGTLNTCNTTINGVPAYEYLPHGKWVLWSVVSAVFGLLTSIFTLFVRKNPDGDTAWMPFIICLIITLGLCGTSGWLFYESVQKETTLQCKPKSG